MPKFEIGQTVKATQTFIRQYKNVCRKPLDKELHEFVVLDIYDDGTHRPVYFATEADKHGNRKGLAEQFLEAV